MATEVTLILWFDEQVPIPTNEEIESEFDCHVVGRSEEEEV